MSIEVNSKIKVLVTGYSPEGHTSFGCQIREVWKRLVKTGDYELVQHGWFHNAKIEPVNWQVIPTNTSWNATGQQFYMEDDKWGQKSFSRVCSQVKPDLVWSLADTYMLGHVGGYRQPLNFKYIQYMPIDGTPSPQNYKDIINNADLSIGCTKWGAEAMSHLTGYKVPYIYHGVDTDVFRPFSQDERLNIRLKSSNGKMTEDCFVIGWVGKDQSRKQSYNPFETLYYLRSGNYVTCDHCGKVSRSPWNYQARSVGALPKVCTHCCQSNKLKQAQPINAMLWAHVYNQPQTGWNLDTLVSDYGLKNDVVFTNGLSRDTGMTTDEMVSLYNCFDTVISFSGGEGFCIPMVEAQACGVPVAYTDYSGQVEISRKGGRPVRVAAMQPEVGTHINRAITCIDDAIKVLREMWYDKQARKRLGMKGRTEMVDNFNHDDLCAQHDKEIKKVMTDSVSLLGVRA